MSRSVELLNACYQDMLAQVGPKAQFDGPLAQKEDRAAEYIATQLRKLGQAAREARKTWVDTRNVRWFNTQILEEMSKVRAVAVQKWTEAHEAYLIAESMQDLFWVNRDQRYRDWPTRRARLARKLEDACLENSALREGAWILPQLPEIPYTASGSDSDCHYCSATKQCDC